jgi:glycosyltransferase involved in cell wall biosynthesis
MTTTSADAAERRRVLVLVENVPVPTDRRVWPECVALKAAGFEIVVVCPQGRRRDRNEFELCEGIPIYRYRMPYAAGGSLSYISEYAVASWHTWRLARRLARDRAFAVVHAANPPDILLPAVWSLKRRGTRFVFDQHDLAPELFLTRFGGRKSMLYWGIRALERLSFSLADVVIAPNNSYREIALRRGQKAATDVFVVRNAPDLSVFRPVEADPTLKRGKPHLLAYVGTMSAQDGLDHAIRALSVLSRKRTDWQAIFVGDGDAWAETRRLVEDLGLDDLVDLTGFLSPPEVVRVLSSADVCLSPEPRNPLNEASTFMKVAEYMAIGRPIVAYDLADTRFSAGPAAAYAVPNDVGSFATRIDELLDDLERRREMGRLGRDRLASELSWEQSKRALLAAYERLLGKDSAPSSKAA